MRFCFLTLLVFGCIGTCYCQDALQRIRYIEKKEITAPKQNENKPCFCDGNNTVVDGVTVTIQIDGTFNQFKFIRKLKFPGYFTGLAAKYGSWDQYNPNENYEYVYDAPFRSNYLSYALIKFFNMGVQSLIAQ